MQSGGQRSARDPAPYSSVAQPHVPARGPAGHFAGEPALRWISASVCRTESCRCSAISSRLDGADAFAALLSKLANGAHPHRPGDQSDPDHDDDDGEEGVPQLADALAAQR